MPESSNHRILTHRFADIPIKVITTVYLNSISSQNQGRIPVNAAWDTGAQKTIITPYLEEILNLQPIYQVFINGVHGRNQSNIVLVDVEFPNGATFKNLEAAVCPFNNDPNSDLHMLIGMDIISQGDFVLSNGGGYTLFSFASPSFPYKIDLAAEMQEKQG